MIKGRFIIIWHIIVLIGFIMLEWDVEFLFIKIAGRWVEKDEYGYVGEMLQFYFESYPGADLFIN